MVEPVHGTGVVAPADQETSVRREAGEIDASREARVKQIIAEIRLSEQFHEKEAFKKIAEDIKFAANIKGDQWEGDEDKYVANITLRHIKDRTASLYAKNPRVRAKSKERMEFTIWDEKQETLQAAMMTMQAAQQQGQLPPNLQQLMALMQDIAAGKARKDVVARVGRTMQILYHHYIDKPDPTFKKQMKGSVTRAITTGIAWVKLGFQREFEKTVETLSQINDITQQLNHLESGLADIADDVIDQDSPRIEELRQSLAVLEQQNDLLVEEGLLHTFPRSDAVIPDKNTTQLSGFIGTGFVAERYMLTPEQVQEVYEVDISSGFTSYKSNADRIAQTTQRASRSSSIVDVEQDFACVYEYYHKPSGTMCVVCDGYRDYLRPPGAPPVSVKRFFPYFAIMFNEIELPEGKIYPPSDVRLLRHQQKEHNRSREALRQHRIAAQPFYAAAEGTLSPEDEDALIARLPHGIVKLQGLPPGTDVGTVVQQFKLVNIDQNLYETNSVFNDIQRTIGQQEANFGTTSGDTATEASIAEGSRISSLSSATDDLEETLTELARAGGDVMLLELDQQTVMEIAGPGAVWPGMRRQDMVDQVYLEIIAGSNGRPNRAQEIANMERMAPVLVQVPGITPAWIARKIVEALDDGVDLSEALTDSAPSILAMNALAQNPTPPDDPDNGPGPNTRDPKEIPSGQGANGANNKAQPAERPPPGRPAFPSPTSASA